MTELKKSPPDPWVTDPIKNEATAGFVIFLKVCDNINMTESELCPPDPYITDPIKKVTDEFLI